MKHNEPLGSSRGVAGVPGLDYLGFKDGGCVCVISLDSAENATFPMGALKNISRSKRGHGS